MADIILVEQITGGGWDSDVVGVFDMKIIEVVKEVIGHCKVKGFKIVDRRVRNKAVIIETEYDGDFKVSRMAKNIIL